MTLDARGELQRAIVDNELELHYQPMFDIDGTRVRGVEALVRWRHPMRGVVSPQAILPLAQSEGLMHDLTTWVIREAMLQTRVWRSDGIELRASVNLAASDLRDDRFRRLLDRSLRIAGEGSFAAEIKSEDADASKAVVLGDLRSRGISVTLDDITSVEQLDRAAGLPLDQVKLGRDVVGRALSDPRAAEIARGIANVAGARALPVIAVGIEDAQALAFARSIGCVGAQGYHLARPMTSLETARWMHSRA